METYLFVYVTIFLVALVQVPIAVDLLRFLFPEWRLARLASKAIYSILFIVMGTIFCIGLGYHLFVYLPLLANDPLHSIAGVLHICFALWIWINMVGNYYLAVFLHPGAEASDKSTARLGEGSGPQQAPSNLQTRVSEVDEREATVLNTHEKDLFLRSRQGLGETALVEQQHSQARNGQTYPTPASFTAVPPRPKTGIDWHPKQTQYCKICQTTVPYLDHHCPFTGNCTGVQNYSNFYVGLWYGVVGLAYAAAITLPYFFECNLKGILWFFGLVQDRHRSQLCIELGAHTHIFLPVFAGFVLSSNMLFIQTIFLLADLSTYNVLKNWRRVPMLRFIRERIRARKYRDPDSRLNMLIVNQRPSLLWYLVPLSNNFFRL